MEDICWIKTNKEGGKGPGGGRRPYLTAANQHPESMLVHTKVRGGRLRGGGATSGHMRVRGRGSRGREQGAGRREAHAAGARGGYGDL